METGLALCPASLVMLVLLLSRRASDTLVKASARWLMDHAPSGEPGSPTMEEAELLTL
jgi:hypothetical protein